MAKWIYTLNSGTALREAIDDDNCEQTARCILKCLEDLVNKLSDEDRNWKGFDIEDLAENINSFLGDGEEEEEIINDFLSEFYDICDDIRAWVGGI